MAAAINEAGSVTMLVGAGARDARAEVLAVAERLAAPMVITLKGKEGLEHDNPYEVGQSGLLGNHASAVAFEGCDLLLMVGTDFPYKEFYPDGKVVVQVDTVGAHIGRRHPVDLPVVGDSRETLTALLPLLEAKTDTGLLDKARSSYDAWHERQARLTDPDYERKPSGLLRRKVDNPGDRVRPELLAAAVDRHAADDAVFTTDTGMATTWLARFVRMRGSDDCWGPSTSARWPMRCPRPSAPRRWTGSSRSSRSAATVA